ncbi:MAG: aminotransferase class I/II-fold pyridoxal phosphate-dependent enzyme [Pseudomonadota bacterium]
MTHDRFGNPLDPSVGYARGAILSSSAAEIRRLRHAQSIAAQVVAERGIEAIAIFTGNPRYFPVKPDDLSALCEEWVGPGLFADEMTEAATQHFGGGDTVAITNRTSAGIVAAILALSDGKPVVSVVPSGDRSHASVIRGCRLAGVALLEVEGQDDIEAAMQVCPALVIVTTVTSTLARLPDDQTRRAIDAGKAAGASVFMDEAYGARLRPVLHGGAQSLTMGADFAITNADKAGLSGPRAGILCGKSDPVLATLAKASELGQEARAPIAAGAMRSLQAFDPKDLRYEARDGQAIADALEGAWTAGTVHRSDLGPMLGEEDVLERVMAQAGRTRAAIVPAEATAAIAMILLRDHGVLTVNTHGAPGGRVSLRLKPTAGALDTVGGAGNLTTALDAAIEEVAERIDDHDWFAQTLLGSSP